jgi:hypothetical protein
VTLFFSNVYSTKNDVFFLTGIRSPISPDAMGPSIAEFAARAKADGIFNYIFQLVFLQCCLKCFAIVFWGTQTASQPGTPHASVAQLIDPDAQPVGAAYLAPAEFAERQAEQARLEAARLEAQKQEAMKKEAQRQEALRAEAERQREAERLRAEEERKRREELRKKEKAEAEAAGITFIFLLFIYFALHYIFFLSRSEAARRAAKPVEVVEPKPAVTVVIPTVSEAPAPSNVNSIASPTPANNVVIPRRMSVKPVPKPSPQVLKPCSVHTFLVVFPALLA